MLILKDAIHPDREVWVDPYRIVRMQVVEVLGQVQKQALPSTALVLADEVLNGGIPARVRETPAEIARLKNAWDRRGFQQGNSDNIIAMRLDGEAIICECATYAPTRDLGAAPIPLTF